LSLPRLVAQSFNSLSNCTSSTRHLEQPHLITSLPTVAKIGEATARKPNGGIPAVGTSVESADMTNGAHRQAGYQFNERLLGTRSPEERRSAMRVT
jgi:hypothetical protein